jgi:hypothetical protein
MRLGRLVAGGIVAGALAGFAAGLLRPRPRGVLPGLAAEADPLTDASGSAEESPAGDHFPRGSESAPEEDLALAARSSRGSRGAPGNGEVAG